MLGVSAISASARPGRENPAWARDVARAGEMQVQPRASRATLGAVLDQSRKRAALSPLFVSLLLVACGPDSQELPPPGVYHFEAVTLENDCNPRLDDVSRGDEVVLVGDDSFNFPIFDYLCVSSEGEECFVTTTYAHQIANREPDTGVYSFGFDWVGSPGCEYRKALELEPTGSDSFTALLTDEWRDAGDCPWAGTGCTVTREYTYTFKKACDDCEFPLNLNE